MTVWLAAAVALLPPLGVAIWVAISDRLADRLVGASFAAAVAGQAMVTLSFAFDQVSILDLPLTLAFLSLPGTLLLAVFMERWM